MLPAVSFTSVLSLDDVARAADLTLLPQVRGWVPRDQRLEALRDELEWSVTTAVTDMDFARGFAAAQPRSGQPARAYLNRWIDVAGDLTVLAGPRYRGRDPNRPFVAIDAASRPLRLADMPRLRAVVAAEFAAFEPGYVTIWDSAAAGAWPGSRSDLRNVAGRLDDLRSNTVPPELDARPAQTLGFYQRYEEIHARQVAVDPDHAFHTRIETREDLDELRAAGTLFEVFRYDVWAGVMAVEPGVQHGLRGYVVIELLLDPGVRGHGYGKHLGGLLARHLDAAGDAFLLGTIHTDNLPSYRSAIASGRIDVGGEVLFDL
jgi:L-amino acid N-acyltransferase YncA